MACIIVNPNDFRTTINIGLEGLGFKHKILQKGLGQSNL